MTDAQDTPDKRPVNSRKRSWWERTVLSWLRKATHSRLVKMHKDLFHWHCETFFPFDQHMSANELAYLDHCFSLSELYPDMPHDTGYEEYSYFTYSHRVKGTRVNSSRMAYGSLPFPAESLASALPILDEQGLLPLLDNYFLHSDNSLFYGIGWDFEAGQRKLYFRVLDLAQLPQSQLTELMEQGIPAAERRKEGLVSFTYVEGALYEEKVYTYPHPETDPMKDLFPGTKGRVVMASSLRGALTQYDVAQPSIWKQRMNETGHAIVAKYAQKGHALDTITMMDQDDYTLYFPGAFDPFAGLLGSGI